MAESKRLIESLLNDLRTLSNESKKKSPQVKEACEAAVVKLRNATGMNPGNLEETVGKIRRVSNEIVHPFLMGCGTKNPKVVQPALAGIQRLIAHRAIDNNSAGVVVSELWGLMEADCEELKVLQTVSLLVSAGRVVVGALLARCLVMCFRMHFAKDPTVVNTASASVRQLVCQTFERIAEEDAEAREGAGAAQAETRQPRALHARAAPGSLRPAAADGYMLLQDICLLISAEAPCWLIGIKEMTRTLGLELLESLLVLYPAVFEKHAEFVGLIKEQVCPLVIKLFSPNLKYIQISSQHPHSRQDAPAESANSDRPYFPISMRLLRVVSVLLTRYYEILVTECEIFLSLLIKFLDGDKLVWQQALALEVLHKVATKPDLLRSFCVNYDSQMHSARILANIVGALAGVVQASFSHSQSVNASSGMSSEESEAAMAQSIAGLQQAGFLLRGVWVPLTFVSTQGAPKTWLLELLDKHDPPQLADGYCLSLAHAGLVDATHSLQQANDMLRKNGGLQHPNFDLCSQFERLSVDDNVGFVLSSLRESSGAELQSKLFASMHASLLAAISTLLEASVDENVTESLLKCVSTLAALACELGAAAERDATVAVLCKAALPADYMSRVVALANAHSPAKSAAPGSSGFAEVASPSQVVAVGTPCPTPGLPPHLANTPVMLTAKNLQAMRLLVGSAHLNASRLQEAWLPVLTCIQHLLWILGLKPTREGALRSGDATDAPGGPVVTTAVMADLPLLNGMLAKLFELTSELDDVALHHVISALCKLSAESMQVAAAQLRDPSFFAVSKLMQTGLANLRRLAVFWKPVSAHLIEICTHPYPRLRSWGAVALTSLVRSALTASEESPMDEEKRQHLIFAPLSQLSDVDHEDVRKLQIDCLMQILHCEGQTHKTVHAALWPTVITAVGAVVSGPFTLSEALVKQGYQAVQLMIADFLNLFSLDCIQLLIEVNAQYGRQQKELNISLSAVGHLWTISDFLHRSPSTSAAAGDKGSLWLVLYTCLSELCVDARPPVRKSACQTLLQTIAAHGQALNKQSWQTMMWKILFPMLDKVNSLTASASTTKLTTNATTILIHHSRDTESKQWAETAVQTLTGVVKIFCSHRQTLLALDNFEKAWMGILRNIDANARSANHEISLAALKNLSELLQQKAAAAPNADLTTAHWMHAWRAWMDIALALAVAPNNTTGGKAEAPPPTPTQLTALLQSLPALFDRVHTCLTAADMAPLVCVLRGAAAIPIATDQAAFILPTAANVTPTQDAVLEAARVVFKQMTTANSPLREALPALIRLILEFATYGVRAPQRIKANGTAYADWVVQNYVPFAELSTRMAVDCYSSTAHFTEIIEAVVLTDVVKSLSVPMSAKYSCPSQSSWKLAVSSLLAVLRLGLPIARQKVRHFQSVWPAIMDAFNSFLFPASEPSTPLNSEERKRHEFLDCQLVELIRQDVLPHAAALPPSFVAAVIELLNRGSFSGVDRKQIAPAGRTMQRTELSRACFDALLAMSQNEPDLVRCVSAAAGASAGGAINSLLSRCRQVMTAFCEDERTSGPLPMAEQRVAEMVNVLAALVTLIRGLEASPAARAQNHADLWMELMEMYLVVVECVRCRQLEVQTAVIDCLKAFKPLLKPL